MNDLLIIVPTILIVVGIVFVGVPYLKNIGWFSKGKLLTEKQVLELIKAVIKELDFEGKSTVEKVLTVSSVAVKYIEQTLKYKDNETKKRLAKDFVYDMLSEMGIKVDDNLERIVSYGIEAAVNSLPKTYQDGKMKIDNVNFGNELYREL